MIFFDFRRFVHQMWIYKIAIFLCGLQN